MAHILIVDDEPSVRDVLTETLKAAGHEVAAAEDGRDALGKLKRRRYDVIVLDIMMPRMNGYEVLEHLRELPGRTDIPVIVVTARHDPTGLWREHEGGAVDHLVKPFFPSELEGAIQRALSSTFEQEERRRQLSTSAEVYQLVDQLHAQVHIEENANKR